MDMVSGALAMTGRVEATGEKETGRPLDGITIGIKTSTQHGIIKEMTGRGEAVTGGMTGIGGMIGGMTGDGETRGIRGDTMIEGRVIPIEIRGTRAGTMTTEGSLRFPGDVTMTIVMTGDQTTIEGHLITAEMTETDMTDLQHEKEKESIDPLQTASGMGSANLDGIEGTARRRGQVEVCPQIGSQPHPIVSQSASVGDI